MHAAQYKEPPAPPTTLGPSPRPRRPVRPGALGFVSRNRARHRVRLVRSPPLGFVSGRTPDPVPLGSFRAPTAPLGFVREPRGRAGIPPSLSRKPQSARSLRHEPPEGRAGPWVRFAPTPGRPGSLREVDGRGRLGFVSRRRDGAPLGFVSRNPLGFARWRGRRSTPGSFGAGDTARGSTRRLARRPARTVRRARTTNLAAPPVAARSLAHRSPPAPRNDPDRPTRARRAGDVLHPADGPSPWLAPDDPRHEPL